ncbi:MAG: SxtJ family membrane protein [Polyangia bacterium]
MLKGALKNISSTRKDLRGFGLVIGVALEAIGAFLWWKEWPHWWTLVAAGGLTSLLALVLPAALKPLQIPWMLLALALGFVVSRILLSVLFYLVLTPMGLIGRLLGKRFLDERIDRRAESYWRVRDAEGDRRERLERQF